MPEDETTSQEPTRSASRFTGLHARTYEMELLVSGAVVLGLLQLPPVVEGVFARLMEGLAGDLRLVVALLQGYVVLGLSVLVCAFVLHLILRAYWIGLLGLESVYPEGIRWEKAQVGPGWLRILRSRLGTLAEAVDRADDLCSLVFPLAFLLVATFLYSIVMLSLSVAVAVAICHLFFAGHHLLVVMWVVFLVLAALQGIPVALDKRAGAKLTPGALADRLLAKLLRISDAMTPMRWAGPIQLTMGTNTSPKRIAALIATICLTLGLGFVVFTVVQARLVRFDSYAYYPGRLDEHGVDTRHYRDRRDLTLRGGAAPSIQSVVVSDPYLELVMRYLPRRHNELIAADCPDLEPLRRDGLHFGRGGGLGAKRVRAVARCVGGLFKTSLDGKRLEDLRWEFTTELGTGLPALTAFIAVENLPSGRHELEVLVPDRKATPSKRSEERHVIPFWR